MTIDQYLTSINKRYRLGNTTELSFRGDLQLLIESMVPSIRATNEPKRQDCGAPDFILTKKEIPVGYIETKDLGDTDLDGQRLSGNKEQFNRYKESLHNIIFTDYLNFHFYHYDKFIAKISIGELTDRGIKQIPENFEKFEAMVQDFCTLVGQTIKSSKKLAEIMAGKAKLLAEIINKALLIDIEESEESSLTDQLNVFRQVLIHDIKPNEYAGMYAQTIVYGMFAARLHDPSLPDFSRLEAYKLIPKTNPFLKQMFGHIAGLDVDDRIRWIVDDLVNIFIACNVREMLKDYGKSTKTEDPIIHFYEDFLSKYDPKERKSRGVWYTPAPVVNFMVRAVDDILKSEFGISDGLADIIKTKIKVDYQGKKIDKEFHRVQILDPAAGTGTFLAEIIRLIHSGFKGQEGIWSQYIEEHLLPRLNGFELLMVSYAIAHLKLDLLLTETGYVPSNPKRLRVFLTNSLEEYHPNTGSMLAPWLSQEANQANQIKRETPVMCVIGNPPYSGESSNQGTWIMQLMENYKMEPGGRERLNERNPKWINDDYVKFLRYAQYFIEKNGTGIVAFINPHGFLDNPTFRGMRWNLLKTYDKIYTIDLHGNSKKKEVSLDGSPDENVFDIMQGVSINFFVKTGRKKSDDLGNIYHFDLFGLRDLKYHFLMVNKFNSINFNELKPIAPYYYFVHKDFNLINIYQKGFFIPDLISLYTVGIATAKDAILIDFDKNNLVQNVRNYYSIAPNINLAKIISYRLFDERFIYYDPKIVERPREKIMANFFDGGNLGLALCKQFKTGDKYLHTFVTRNLMESSYVSNRTSEITSIFPLYLYSTINGQQTFDHSNTRAPNLNPEIVEKIADGLKLQFTPEKEETEGTFAPIDVLDYIYAVLHSPIYREKYKEFLKIDFPRVPYPKDTETFWQLVQLGREIREFHLMESKGLNANCFISEFPISGTNVVERIFYKNGYVYINETQFFVGIPESVWNFYIGGYQPAQKWLKDRKGRELNFEDVMHYHKIIVALHETERLMNEIAKIDFE